MLECGTRNGSPVRGCGLPSRKAEITRLVCVVSARKNRCPSRTVQDGVGNQGRHPSGVDQGDDRIVVSGHDQRGLTQPPQAGLTTPAGHGQLLEQVADATRATVSVFQVVDQSAACACLAAVQVARDLPAMSGVIETSRSTQFAQGSRASRGLPGCRQTSRPAPAFGIAVDAVFENCWARVPPHDTPNTSTIVFPSVRNNRAVNAAAIDIVYGRRGAADSPAPGNSKETTSLPSATASASGAMSSIRAQMPFNISNGVAPLGPTRSLPGPGVRTHRRTGSSADHPDPAVAVLTNSSRPEPTFSVG